MATLCCCPPESSVTFDLAFVSKPTILGIFQQSLFLSAAFSLHKHRAIEHFD